MGQVCSDDTEVSQYVEFKTTNDHIILQQAFEVQCDEKPMMYYKTFPELNVTNILGVILSRIHFDHQRLLCPVWPWQLKSSSLWIYYVKIIPRQRINELRR